MSSAAWEQALKHHHDRCAASDDLSNLKPPCEATPGAVDFYIKLVKKCGARYEEALPMNRYEMQAAITTINRLSTELGRDAGEEFQKSWDAQDLPQQILEEQHRQREREEKERKRKEKHEESGRPEEIEGQMSLFDQELPQAEAAGECVTVTHEDDCALLQEELTGEELCTCGALKYCEGCPTKVATHSDSEGVPLCAECHAECVKEAQEIAAENEQAAAEHQAELEADAHAEYVEQQESEGPPEE